MEVSLYEVEGSAEITALRGLLEAMGQLIGLPEADEFPSINCYGIKSTLKSNDTKPSFPKGYLNPMICLLKAYKAVREERKSNG